VSWEVVWRGRERGKERFERGFGGDRMGGILTHLNSRIERGQPL
jgi:hypothetical protein